MLLLVLVIALVYPEIIFNNVNGAGHPIRRQTPQAHGSC
jgi:hypothetical protein